MTSPYHLTKREKIAAMALQGLLASAPDLPFSEVMCQEFAREAAMLADALLEQLVLTGRDS